MTYRFYMLSNELEDSIGLELPGNLLTQPIVGKNTAWSRPRGLPGSSCVCAPPDYTPYCTGLSCVRPPQITFPNDSNSPHPWPPRLPLRIVPPQVALPIFPSSSPLLPPRLRLLMTLLGVDFAPNRRHPAPKWEREAPRGGGMGKLIFQQYTTTKSSPDNPRY